MKIFQNGLHLEPRFVNFTPNLIWLRKILVDILVEVILEWGIIAIRYDTDDSDDSDEDDENDDYKYVAPFWGLVLCRHALWSRKNIKWFLFKI